MPSGFQATWEPGLEGPGMPPDPKAADSFKGCVVYRLGRNPAWDFDDESTSHYFGDPNMPNGAYEIWVYGYSDGVWSKPVKKTYVHTTGTDPIDPVFGPAPPAGDDSVATPTDLSVTEAP